MKRKVLLLIFISIILCFAAILLLLTQTGNNNYTSIPPADVPAGFVRISGGTFTMGSPVNEPGRWDDEGPQRRVTVSSFSMGINPVTVGEFRRFVNAKNHTEAKEAEATWDGSRWDTSADASWRDYFTHDNHPVVFVRWFYAIEYCNWLSVQEGLTPAYTISGSGDNRTVTWNRRANGYRLPTEAEWEYACRAGTTTAYNTVASITTVQANFYDTLGRTTPVGNYAANGWGLHDKHGNVWEWCWDWYGSYPRNTQRDPAGASAGSDRVLRGGGWYSSVERVRSANRRFIAPSDWGYDTGFRLVRN